MPEEKQKLNIGLTSDEAEKRAAAGEVNAFYVNPGKSTWGIIAENVFTYFNAIFVGLAILVIIAGSYKDISFVPIIIANTLIGIIQQLRSKHIIQKLTVLSVAKYICIRDGGEAEIRADKLVKGDVIYLTSGQQIPADAVVVSGTVTVNEALLTGEADEIEKNKDDELLSGSFVVSGKCLIRLTKVGSESYAARLTIEAKKVHEKKSEMIKDIDIIVITSGILIIPIGILLFHQSMNVLHMTFSESVVSMVGCLIGMIPEGLYLLVTVALAISTIKLGLSGVLLHDMRSIETLARVDVLCVDKTGTITDSVMTVTDIFPAAGFSEKPSDMDNAKDILKQYLSSLTDNNDTAEAIRAYLSEFEASVLFSAVKAVPFDSKKKYSEVVSTDGTFRLGAPEYLVSKNELEWDKERLDSLIEEGKRVLVFTHDGKALLYIVIENAIRKNAKEIFGFFEKQGVAIKVISGDNALAVSKVAMKAGVEKAERFVDMGEVASDVDFHELVKNYTVFGRVRPEQKRALVTAIRENGQKVAMTGDGVNDILAMKEADCSIAMGSGCEAAANAAQVVLLDSDFYHMKEIVAEGRTDINNIVRSATLFIYKNLFSLCLAIFSIINVLPYPLEPSQVVLVSMFNIGLPALLLAFEPNTKKQEGEFIVNVLKRSAPPAVAAFLAVAVMVTFGGFLGIPNNEIGTACTYLLSVPGFLMLIRICRPMNSYRLPIIIFCIAAIVGGSLLLPGFFSVGPVGPVCLVLFIILAVAEDSVMENLERFFRFIEKRIRIKRGTWNEEEELLKSMKKEERIENVPDLFQVIQRIIATGKGAKLPDSIEEYNKKNAAK